MMLPFFTRRTEARSRPETGRSTWQRHGGAPEPDQEADARQADQAKPWPRRVDFVVIGGGFAGLSTALALVEAEPLASIVVLEARFVGFGSSGRNAGLLGPLPAPLWLASADRQPEHLWGLLHLNRRVHETARWLAAEVPASGVEARSLRIEAQGFFTGSGLARVGRLLESARLGHQLVGGARGHLAIDLDAHTVDPYRTVRALAALARRKGISIIEHAAVRAVDERVDDVVVSSEAGDEVAARAVVVCTNAYTASLGLPQPPKAKVVHNFMVATNQVPLERLVLPGVERRFVVELNTAYVYYRVHQNRVVYGGIERFKPFGSSDFDVPPDVLAGLERLIGRSFPGAGLVPEEAWGGIYHQTATDLPIIERRGSRGAIVLNVGYGGTGVAMTMVCGRLAAGLARGGRLADPDDERLLAAFRSTRVPVGGLARFVTGVGADIACGRRPRVPDERGR